VARGKLAIIAICGVITGAVVLGAAAIHSIGWPTDPTSMRVCSVTGGGQLRVCHDAADEGVYYRPAATSAAYNVQIIHLDDNRYATILHSEAKDMAHYLRLTGHVRPGDSIKAGVTLSSNPDRVPLHPGDLDYKIWGSLKNANSYLYYAVPPEVPEGRGGESGGGNPMVVAGAGGDPHFYVFFLATSSDNFEFKKWRNVLLEARTPDFETFELLQEDRNGHSAWVPFDAEKAMPAAVRSTAGLPIVSNRSVTRTPQGALPVFGLIGSIVAVAGRYYYFYTDQDPTIPNVNHLYVRYADDVSHNERWSEPTIIMDTPPEILIRVSLAPEMDRWVIFYNCARSTAELVFDVCIQYTSGLDLVGPHGIGGLQLFDGPVYTGRSRHFMGLRGVGNNDRFKAQNFYLANRSGALDRPEGGTTTYAGLITWTALPRNMNVFGAPVYWGRWTAISGEDAERQNGMPGH
jgi:hypothetical protein